MNQHVMYTDRPFPVNLFRVTHPLFKARIDHTDVADTHRKNAPAYMSEIKEKRNDQRI